MPEKFKQYDRVYIKNTSYRGLIVGLSYCNGRDKPHYIIELDQVWHKNLYPDLQICHVAIYEDSLELVK